MGTITDDPLDIRTNNSSAIFIDAFQKVGIGEVAPDSKLEVNGTLHITGNSSFDGSLALTKGTSANIDGNDEIVVPAVSWLYLTSAGATDNLDGIGAGTEGQIVFLTPVAGKDITLVHDGTVTAGKKLMINGEANVTLDADHDFAIAVYDATATVWNVMVPGIVDVLTTRGDLIRRGASAPERFAAVAAGAVVGGNGTDVVATVPKRTVVLTAAGGAPTTTSPCSDATKVEAGTNDVDYWVLDFATAGTEYAFWTLVMPDNYDGGTITFIPYWTAASGSGTVKWQLAGRSFANSDPLDAAYTDAGEVSEDTLLTAGDVHIGPESSAVTLNGGPAGGEYVQIRVTRDTSDSLGVDARLLAIKIEYTTNSVSD